MTARLDALLAFDPTTALMEAMKRADELGLKPISPAVRATRRVQYLMHLAKFGNAEWSAFATDELKRGREAAVRRKLE